MSEFVDKCRKEWNRLGVPEAVSNEMAADLEADLAEAEAEGASPEEVLGNGVFDARSFAASWAAARGIVNPSPRLTGAIRRPPWTATISAAVSLLAILAGLVLLGGLGRSSAAVAAVRRSIDLPGPGGPFGPRHVTLIGPLPGRMVFLGGSALHPLGWLLIASGLVWLGVALWLWRPWSTPRTRSGFDDNVRLPSYL
jgi:hypothetical protein